MTPNEQMMQFIMMLKNQQNPKSIVLNMIEQNASQNPVLANLLTLAKNNDSKGITIYNNYYLTDTVKELIKNNKISINPDEDLLFITEQNRRESMK